MLLLLAGVVLSAYSTPTASNKPRVIVTSDGEIDDQCSLVRFLLYANEWDIEAIVTSSSQYHWQGHHWAGDAWVRPYLDAYAKVLPNLTAHDRGYPTPEYLRARTLLGNVRAEGEMDEVTPGSTRIVNVLLDDTDQRPVWIQAWGGTNTIAPALKAIEEQHPGRMAEIASKIRFFFIWEQDGTYQSYIRPHWGRFEIPTIVSDQFWAIAYDWNRILPPEKRAFFTGDWMTQHILQNHGPLCALYKAKDNGEFRSEGDLPAFLHVVNTGLRSTESPGWGGWGGRYVRVRDNSTGGRPVDDWRLVGGYRPAQGRSGTVAGVPRQQAALRQRDVGDVLAGPGPARPFVARNNPSRAIFTNSLSNLDARGREWSQDPHWRTRPQSSTSRLEVSHETSNRRRRRVRGRHGRAARSHSPRRSGVQPALLGVEPGH